ncbi:MAG: lipoate--protein ligase [Bacilli bacterium]|jgi:lipoyltransferase/lipoate-protein ligase|nr:lipoate--protein ligase [Bacilli bacterium]
MKALDLEQWQTNEISFYLALEQYVLSNLDDDVFFLWDIPPSVVIGRNQLLQAEVNVAYAKEEGVPIYRRPSGGGAIYADDGCFMYSFVTKEKRKEQLMQYFVQKMIVSLKKLGVDASFSGRNDLMFANKKFSGTAILQKQEGSIVHGTFLYDTDIEKLVRILQVDPLKIISKGIQSVKERVINLKPYLDKTKKEVMHFLIHDIGDQITYLSPPEWDKVKEIEKKFASKEWIEDQNPPYTVHRKMRFPCGMLDIYLDIKNKKIKSLQIKGDYFEMNPIETWVSYFQQIPFTKQDFSNVLKNHPVDRVIQDAKNEEIIQLIWEETE